MPRMSKNQRKAKASPPSRPSGASRKNCGKKLKQYSDTLFQSAIEAALAGAEIKVLVKRFNLPATTLRTGYKDALSNIQKLYEISQSDTLIPSITDPPPPATIIIDNPETDPNPASPPQHPVKQVESVAGQEASFTAESPESGFQEQTMSETGSDSLKKNICQTYCCTCLVQELNELEVINETVMRLLRKYILRDPFFGLNINEMMICKRCSLIVIKMEEFIENCIDSLKSLTQLREVEQAKEREQKEREFLQSVNALENLDEFNVLNDFQDLNYLTSLTGSTVFDELGPPSDLHEITSELNLGNEIELGTFNEQVILPIVSVTSEQINEVTLVSNPCEEKVEMDEEEEEKDDPTTEILQEFLDKSLFCSLCETFYETSTADHLLQVHTTVNSNDNTYICVECNNNTVFAKDIDLFNHLLNEHIKYPAPVKCPGCELAFIYRKHFWSHLATHATDFICDICQRRFPVKKELRKHIESHHLKERLCKYCNHVFPNGSQYDDHVRAHKEPSLICYKCNKRFKNYTTLKKHRKEVCGSKGGTCTICNNSFPTLSKLNYHIKAVHESPQHLCTYCGRKFTFAMALKKHIGNKHDPALLKPRKCAYCNKVFKSKCHLAVHIGNVHGNVKWKCKLCDAAYTSKNGLTVHIYSHLNGKRPLVCHLCNNGYYTVAYIKQHYEKRHSLFLNNEEIYKTCRRVFIDENLILKIN